MTSNMNFSAKYVLEGFSCPLLVQLSYVMLWRGSHFDDHVRRVNYHVPLDSARSAQIIAAVYLLLDNLNACTVKKD